MDSPCVCIYIFIYIFIYREIWRKKKKKKKSTSPRVLNSARERVFMYKCLPVISVKMTLEGTFLHNNASSEEKLLSIAARSWNVPKQQLRKTTTARDCVVGQTRVLENVLHWQHPKEQNVRAASSPVGCLQQWPKPAGRGAVRPSDHFSWLNPSV